MEWYTYLLKIGELSLKKGNRAGFERILRQNLVTLLRGSKASVTVTNGRFYVRTPSEGAGQVEDALDRLMGITGWARTKAVEKTPCAVRGACIEVARELAERGIKSFKVEARRTDKRFPLDSYGIRCDAGQAIREAVPALAVDVHTPQAIIEVEIRERAYIYAMEQKGRRGLPSGTAGRGLLLLSGGIDSPAAGYMMLSRGMALDAVYFHAYPYTAEEARQKVIRIAEILGSYSLGIRLFTVGFTAVQMRIKERAPLPWTTVLLRMAMMECAEELALRRHCKCLITGESLSQVASQTAENISCAQSRVSLPVFRPLIGMDKEQIIRVAESIGTYETSILPYEDCCVIFSPPHPILRGDSGEAGELYEKLELSELIVDALNNSAVDRCGFPAVLTPLAGSSRYHPGLTGQAGTLPPPEGDRPGQIRWEEEI
ncbi:MAG: tRNA 4-thiouridine(8) synthase ThiI [Treponema sp.]|nr:tRNA 4-thiouridine(8) synthase ThiI [Treponema sp.]